jgi:sulfide dehydrogenase cytochrome subunit
MEWEPLGKIVNKARISACGLTTALIIGSPVVAAQSAETYLTANCSECHGINGVGTEPDIPHLNGQLESLLATMLNDFRNDKRSPKVRIHREIPADRVNPLAKHYSQQVAVRPKSATNPELVARGEAIYQKRCAECHIDAGRESDKEAPLLAGQSLTYLIAQSMAYKRGERKYPYLMDDAYRDISEADLVAIAHYFATEDQVASQRGRKRRR